MLGEAAGLPEGRLRSCRRSFKLRKTCRKRWSSLAVTKRIQASAGTMPATTPAAIHQLSRRPLHRTRSMPLPNRTTRGTSGTPNFIAGRVAPL
jgi:hypothetical protein